MRLPKKSTSSRRTRTRKDPPIGKPTLFRLWKHKKFNGLFILKHKNVETGIVSSHPYWLNETEQGKMKGEMLEYPKPQDSYLQGWTLTQKRRRYSGHRDTFYHHMGETFRSRVEVCDHCVKLFFEALEARKAARTLMDLTIWRKQLS